MISRRDGTLFLFRWRLFPWSGVVVLCRHVLGFQIQAVCRCKRRDGERNHWYWSGCYRAPEGGVCSPVPLGGYLEG
jgi:hypothetical protein